MAKWAVILTVTVLCFSGVLSQTPSNIQNVSAEENNSTATSLNANVTSDMPSASTGIEDPPASAETNNPIETSAKENLSQTPAETKTSTFPPLVHNEFPETTGTPATTVAIPTTPTNPTTKAPEIKEAVTEMSQAPTTHKPNSSNRLHLSLIVSFTSVLIWKFSY